MHKLSSQIKQLIFDWGLGKDISSILYVVSSIAIILIIALVIDKLARKVILLTIDPIVKKSPFTWDDTFVDNNVFRNMAHFMPIIAIEILSKIFLKDYPDTLNIVHTIFEIAILLVSSITVVSIISAIAQIGTHENNHRTVAVQTFSQLLKVITYAITFIVLISLLLNVNIKHILSGLGVVSAILLLIFKDTILGFVSGIQLAVTKSVKVGDWINIREYNIDGDIIEINLVTVKIRNFDKTISTIPTYSLVSSTVQNLSTIQELNIRRMKRSIIVESSSIKFCKDSDYQKYMKIDLLSEFITNNKDRKLTNLGIFRTYIQNYLIDRTDVSNDMPIIIRNMIPLPEGIPC